MKGKVYQFIPLLLVAIISSLNLTAQPDYSRRDDDRRYDRNDRYDRSDRYDRNDRYDNRYDKDRRHSYHNEIRRRPGNPYYTRPMRPSSFHVWIDGDWMWGQGRYYYQNGYWAVPQRGHVWVPGHWQRGRHGWYWVNGFWQYDRRSRW